MQESGGGAPSRRRPKGVWGKPPAADGWILRAKPSATESNRVWRRSPKRSAIFTVAQQN